MAEAELESIIGLPRELMVQVKQLVSNHERVLHTVRVDGVSPRNLAWLLVSNVAGDMLAGGHHHVYRGVLGMTGEALQKAFDRAVVVLEEGGYHDSAAAAKDRAWLRERIREVG